MRRWLCAVVLLLWHGGDGSAGAPPSPVAPPYRHGATTSGATFMLPSAWSLQQKLWLIVMRPPEADLRVVIVEVGRASDAVMAAAAAWALYRAAGARAVTLSASRGPHHGWDEAARLDYTQWPGGEDAACAVALRRGARFSVVILEGSEATARKRRDEILTILESMRPARL